jgi:hypothetical protein
MGKFLIYYFMKEEKINNLNLLIKLFNNIID